jgi:hypothetical protein
LRAESNFPSGLPPSIEQSRASPSSRSRSIVYWIATLYVSVESAVAGTMDILRLPPLFGILIHLGYPAYFGRILGV